MTTVPIEYLLYGLASLLSLSVAIIGSLIVYTINNVKDSVVKLQESCESLTSSLNNLIEKFEVNKTITEKQFELELQSRTTLEKLFTARCDHLESEIESLRNTYTAK